MTTGTSKWMGLGAAALAAALAAACSETEADTDAYGPISAAIATTGSDGATYRLADGAYVQVVNASFNDSFSLDGDTPTVSFDVPVGTYDVYIGNYYGPLDLLRVGGDGTPELVSAQLITPLPLTVDVSENMTSQVAFQFQVSNGGTITFGQGTLEVAINVDAQDVLGGRAQTTGNVTADYVDADPLILPRVPAVGETVWHYLEVAASPSWTQASANSACTTGTWIGYGITQAGYTDTLDEALADNNIQICVYGNAYGPALSITASRDAAVPLTATYADLGAPLSFYVQVYTPLSQPVFDGQTLDLGALEGSVGGLGAYTYQYVWRADGSTVLQSGYSGPMTFTFWPE
jgi:hypothetical protein